MANVGFYKTSVKHPISGDKLFTVRLVPYSVISGEEATALACKDSNINDQDLAVGFAALTQAIEAFVFQGHSVTLEGLGNFRLTAKSGVWDAKAQKWVSGGSKSMDDVTPDKIKGVYVRFRPCTSLRREMQHVGFFDVTKTAFGGVKGRYDYTVVGKKDEGVEGGE